MADRAFQRMLELHRHDETTLIKQLAVGLEQIQLPWHTIEAEALLMTQALRQSKRHGSGVDSLMLEYDLSTSEGIALMCLAEALLRIPNASTRDALIRDKLTHANWQTHLGHSQSLFVNAATWGLLLAGKWERANSDHTLRTSLEKVWLRGGQILIRKSVEAALALLSRQFVMAEDIEGAIVKAEEQSGFLYSFDMLGEAAQSEAEAVAYAQAYEHALDCLGENEHADLTQGHGISVKLSALCPRYTPWQREAVHEQLYPRLLTLCQMAKDQRIGLNIDAEESDRLVLSLELIKRLLEEPSLDQWSGLGVVVQAYQTRATAVIDYLIALAKAYDKRIMVRLVKGAYWDSEIKHCQQLGLSHYPVFTQKHHTDISYLVCADKLLENHHFIYAQFATHNAHTVASVRALVLKHGVRRYEMQCLHGMGEQLYERLLAEDEALRCRVYAPVGPHETLLPYLVRRLLENGANSSFVHQLVDSDTPLADLVRNPLDRLKAYQAKPNPVTPLPAAIFTPRENSAGIDLHCAHTVLKLRDHMQASKPIGLVQDANEAQVAQAYDLAQLALPAWRQSTPRQRANYLLKAGDLLQEDMPQWTSWLVTEAKKTLPNAVGEVREAIDFCRYYAEQLEELPSPANTGLAVCISPWNFPLAITLGQIAGALAAGHVVLAKPAEQTPWLGLQVVELLHRAGVPKPVVQCLSGGGHVGAWLTALPNLAAVVFTGSNPVAKQIQQAVLTHGNPQQPAVLIAETGGINAMVVDSSAHLEQVVQDVILSGFDSAGQRCSALRLLCVQDDIADALLEKLKGAIATLKMGMPSRLTTDISPVIDEEAFLRVIQHIDHMRKKGLEVWQAQTHGEYPQQLLLPPTLIELQELSDLKAEVFGPVVHILRYGIGELEPLVQRINELGYGLTFGIHTRIDQQMHRLAHLSLAGNIYVNRNMVGAVVGSNCFGGRGLSGTGPKAGGPLYLPRLMGLSHLPVLHKKQAMPSVTGESNLYQLLPLGEVWCAAQSHAARNEQVQLCLDTANTPVFSQPLHAPGAVLAESNEQAAVLSSQVARAYGGIVPVFSPNAEGQYPSLWLHREQLVCTNLTAAGGNIHLLSQGAVVGDISEQKDDLSMAE